MTLAIQTDRIEPLSPSCKLVYLILQEAAPLTRQQLVDRSLLPERTVEDAVKTLCERDLVQARAAIRDGRQRLYVLGSGAEVSATIDATGSGGVGG